MSNEQASQYVMLPIHQELAAGRWHTLSLVEQLANVGSDVARAARWHGKDMQRCDQAFERAMELLDLTSDGKAGGKNSPGRENSCAMPCSAEHSRAVTWLRSIGTSSTSLSQPELGAKKPWCGTQGQDLPL